MPQQKKQHYVPKFLLKNFSNNGKIYLYNVGKNSLINNTIPYTSQCQAVYMYSADLKYENFLADIESKCSAIIKDKILEDKQISCDDEKFLKQFVLIQFVRTKKIIENQQWSLCDAYKRMLPIISNYYDWNLSDADIKNFARNEVLSIKNCDYAKGNLQHVINNLNAIDNLNLVILNNASNVDFAISDAPVLIDNVYQHKYGLGYDCAGIIFLLPICPKKYLLVSDEKMYPNLKNKKVISLENDTDINKINRLQLKYNKENLYALRCDTLVELKNYANSCFDNWMRKFFTDIKDPIIQNLKIIEIKNNPLFKNLDINFKALVPKENLDTLSIFEIAPVFAKFKNKHNYVFPHNINWDKISWKLADWGEEFYKALLTYDNKNK